MKWGDGRATLFGALLFAAMALSIPMAGNGTPGLDVTITNAVQGLDSGALSGVATALNWLGDTSPSLALGGLAVLLLAYFHRTYEASIIFAGVLVRVFNPMLKELLDSPRPDGSFIQVSQAFSGYGFPSGHASSAMLLYGGLIYVAGRMGPFPGQRLVQGFAALMIAGIGFSRIYVGAHWPTDVLGGYLWGATFLLAAVAISERVWEARAAREAEEGVDVVYASMGREGVAGERL